MAEKSITEQITEHEQAIEKLKAKLAEQSKKDFPKWIPDPNDPDGKAGREAQTPEEEKAIVSGYAKASASAKRKAELQRKIRALEAEAEQLEVEPVKPTAAEAKRVHDETKAGRPEKVSKRAAKPATRKEDRAAKAAAKKQERDAKAAAKKQERAAKVEAKKQERAEKAAAKKVRH